MIKGLLFDWGNTIMVDFNLPGPMCDWEKVAWVDGAEEALTRIRGVFPCHIASNAPQSDGIKLKKALERVGAHQFFDEIFSSSDIGFEKPDSNFFSAVMSRLQAEPNELVMIGDNYVKDIEGAGKCGIKTIFFNANGKEGDFSSADIIISHMKELPDAILQLEE